MAEWIKNNKVYFFGGVLALCALLYYFFMPPEKTNGLPGIDQAELAERKGYGKTADEDLTNASVQPQLLLVDVKGAVKKPGVYEAKEGDRVIDILEKAGGLTDNADTYQINFALRVSDEMVMYIPEKGEAAADTGRSESAINVKQNDGKIDLNKATESELQTLPGIGPSKAAAILEHRESNGPFKAIEDLKLIAGIGDKTFEKLKEFIKVN